MPTHLDVMKYIADEYYDIAYPFTTKIRLNIMDDTINNLLSEFSEFDLSDIKKNIIITVIGRENSI